MTPALTTSTLAIARPAAVSCSAGARRTVVATGSHVLPGAIVVLGWRSVSSTASAPVSSVQCQCLVSPRRTRDTVGPYADWIAVAPRRHGQSPLSQHGLGQLPLSGRRAFSSTAARGLKVKQWFPPTNADKIKYAGPAWTHPVYTNEQMDLIRIDHRNAENWQDRLALRLMRMARWCMDRATGYTEYSKAPAATQHGDKADGKATERPWLVMDERKWLIRIVFLESIAGVPGMVGGMLRHLHSLRRMKRDNGWIETLLEEAYNERMHLLTFLKLAEPGWFMRVMILGAQGVFFNGFFLSYLLSPQTCHRFVGYLEEEAVYTYSRIIREIDAGNLPAWTDSKFQVPDIAIQYWNMPENRRTMRDLMLYVRADEAKHREVNHTLGNLNQDADPNPFTSVYKDNVKPHPEKGIANIRAKGWERDEVI